MSLNTLPMVIAPIRGFVPGSGVKADTQLPLKHLNMPIKLVSKTALVLWPNGLPKNTPAKLKFTPQNYRPPLARVETSP